MIIVGKMEIPDADKILKDLGLNAGGDVQRGIDSAFLRYCEPYVPFDEGVLTASAWSNTKIGSGVLVWDTPYAHYQYMGTVYGPNFQVEIGGEMQWRSPAGAIKYPTDRKLNYNMENHPLAGSHWADRCAADHGEDIIREAVEQAQRSRK